MTTDTSTIQRVTYRKRETTAVLLEADNMSVRTDVESGEAVIELFRYHDATGKPMESYQMRLCREDRQRLKHVL